MVTATAKATNPDDILVTISLTMTVGEWKRLSDDMPTNSGWAVSRAIDKALAAFIKTAEGVVDYESDRG
jgi:hypothetical protein